MAKLGPPDEVSAMPPCGSVICSRGKYPSDSTPSRLTNPGFRYSIMVVTNIQTMTMKVFLFGFMAAIPGALGMARKSWLWNK
jgi:hypothetical protein